VSQDAPSREPRDVSRKVAQKPETPLRGPGHAAAQSRLYAQRIALCGLLTTLMLVLGYVESQIPLMPAIPGVKLGLSNAVLLYAVYLLSPSLTVGLMLVKVLLSAVLFGNPFALAFSLAGGALSVAGMLLLKRFASLGVVGISVAGAVLHNAGQMLIALALVGNANLLYYAAVLTLVGIGTGILTGVVAGLVMKAGVGMAVQAGMKPGNTRQGKPEKK